MKKFKVGVQLYSVRNEMEKDFEGTLKAISEMGYDYVEFAGFFGHTADEVSKILDKYNLEAISAHLDHTFYFEQGEELTEFLKALGIKYWVVPFLNIKFHMGSDQCAYEEIAEVCKILKDKGIKMLYHNHDFEFEAFEGKLVLDWLYEIIPADLLEAELDTCWARYAGFDPAEIIRKYSGRAPIVHLKDFVRTKKPGKERNYKEEPGFMFKPVGYGCQDFRAILEAAEDAGSEYIIVEMDQSPEMPPLEAMRLSREYLKTLGQ